MLPESVLTLKFRLFEVTGARLSDFVDDALCWVQRVLGKVTKARINTAQAQMTTVQMRHVTREPAILRLEQK